jgi:hypothetical protein
MPYIWLATRLASISAIARPMAARAEQQCAFFENHFKNAAARGAEGETNADLTRSLLNPV